MPEVDIRRAVDSDVEAIRDLFIESYGRLVVHPNARWQGIGSRLMEARLQFACSLGDKLKITDLAVSQLLPTPKP